MVSSITRTATDAVAAKWSALLAGYVPVARNLEVYEDLMEKVMLEGFPLASKRRQPPLINAGYAMRVASISFAIDAFVFFHTRRDPDLQIQIVFLGCGLDIIGLWSFSLSPDKIQVWEIDSPEICNTKRDLLVKEGLVEPATDKCSVAGIFSGCVQSAGTKDSCSKLISNYKLISADLQNIDSVKQNMSLSSPPDRSIPTLVISEVVLVYLHAEGSNQLLEWCAATLCSPPGSCMVVYEPLGPHQAQCSVTEAYKFEYCHKFKAKLNRGLATTSVASEESEINAGRIEKNGNEKFHPLGFSCQSIEDSFKNVGFIHADSCLAGKSASVAQAAGAKIGVAPEMFDEHAALVLHLSSYVFACAFPANTDILFRKFICPWKSSLSTDIILQPLKRNDNPTVFLSHLESIEDDEQLRENFCKTYEGMYEEFPSVKKMVKTAMKRDLASSTVQCSGLSSIGTRYRGWEGDFVVAVQYRNTPTNQDSRNELSKVIIGGIGVRRCKQGEKNARDEASSGNTYEIHRFFVNEAVRGMGIGKLLLNAAEKVICDKSVCGCRIVAATPAVLIAANKLYQSCGYTIYNEVISGNILIRTFVKNLI